MAACTVGGHRALERAFKAAMVALVLVGIVPVGDVYRRIDWSVVVMLAVVIPLGGALLLGGRRPVGYRFGD
ncbi:MAG: hypothetical protein LDL44_02785 [Caenispirillum sp.]|nr:hypothetical protein [Caenispirillum sp.]